jgi:hypothetical protein
MCDGVVVLLLVLMVLMVLMVVMAVLQTWTSVRLPRTCVARLDLWRAA